MAKIYGIPSRTTTPIPQPLPTTTATAPFEPTIDDVDLPIIPPIDKNPIDKNGSEPSRALDLCRTGLKAVVEIDENCFVLSSNHFTECHYQNRYQNFTMLPELWPGISNISAAFHFQGNVFEIFLILL